MIGARGVNLIERRILEMGYLWYPSGGVEAGIDGRLEIRNENAEVTNLILSVQSKATDGAFEGETATELTYTCSERDLRYWLKGNLPVILVYSRPRTDEAYWLSVKDYFSDPIRRASRKMRFVKAQHGFDQTAEHDLRKLALPDDGGLYLGTTPKQETIFTDLLPVAQFPERYYHARTTFPARKQALDHLFSLAKPSGRDVCRGFTIHGSVVYSFHDLSATQWQDIVDVGTVESDLTFEWSMTHDADRKKLFVELLNVTLQDQLREDDIHFSNMDKFYFHRASDDLSDRKRKYRSRRKNASREVFKRYQSKLDPERTSYFRHVAFFGHFLELDGNWFLQITPTYRFTKDGYRDSRFSADALSGIKRLENNQAVHGQVFMWADFLQKDTLFSRHNLLKFYPLMQFTADSGFEDADWVKREEKDRQETVFAEDQEEQAELEL
ncbi:MAG TPA: DUF4365 domain-containing protein [Acidisarcina sp.]|nr:DUF4365 domain-containing protein [Acidisarcina sp.]